MITVYIASPYTIGDVAINVKAQIDIADELISLGLAPFVPLYSHFQHMHHPRPYEDWIRLDNEWVLRCDCVLRLPGESRGADAEVALAVERNIPVFYTMSELVNFVFMNVGFGYCGCTYYHVEKVGHICQRCGNEICYMMMR